MHEGESNGLTTAITAGQNAGAQITATITTAQNLLAAGNLTPASIAALTTALNAALTAQGNLAAAVIAAQNALAQLNTAAWRAAGTVRRGARRGYGDRGGGPGRPVQPGGARPWRVALRKNESKDKLASACSVLLGVNPVTYSSSLLLRK